MAAAIVLSMPFELARLPAWIALEPLVAAAAVSPCGAGMFDLWLRSLCKGAWLLRLTMSANKLQLCRREPGNFKVMLALQDSTKT